MGDLAWGDPLLELFDRQLDGLGVLTGDFADLILLLRGKLDANLILRHGILLGVELGGESGVEHGSNLGRQREDIVNSVVALP